MEDLRKNFQAISKKFLKSHTICERCGAKAEDVHHKTPLVYGGTNDEDNLAALCKRCHYEWDLYEDIGMEFDAFLLTPSFKAIASAIMACSSKCDILSESVVEVCLNIHDAEVRLNQSAATNQCEM